jgi:hypothetical protein
MPFPPLRRKRYHVECNGRCFSINSLTSSAIFAMASGTFRMNATSSMNLSATVVETRERRNWRGKYWRHLRCHNHCISMTECVSCWRWLRYHTASDFSAVIDPANIRLGVKFILDICSCAAQAPCSDASRPLAAKVLVTLATWTSPARTGLEYQGRHA